MNDNHKVRRKTTMFFSGGFVTEEQTSLYWLECWYDKEGRLHRDNGLPAVVRSDGHTAYWTQGSFKGWRDSNTTKGNL